MRYKKIMILAIFLVSLLSVSAVSAEDNVTDDVVGVEETTDEVVSLDNDNQVILEETNVGTFTDLANEIAKAKGELNLNKNYKYASSDSDYKEGIAIEKSIVINGNGHTINGNNQARIFNVRAEVVLNNIYFVNGNANDAGGGAIFFSGDGADSVLSDCSFENCVAEYGGAICCYGDNVNLQDCIFRSSYSTDGSGGAIYWDAADGTVSGCSFKNCAANGGGGSVCRFGEDGVLTNCYFENSYSTGGGGAVHWGNFEGGGVLSDCIFVNCSSDEGHGGAVSWSGDYGSLSNCSFVNSHVAYWYSGGAVYWIGDYGHLSDCSFVNSDARGSLSDGGAVYWSADYGHLSDCSFVNSFAGCDGGAVYWSGEDGVLINSIFVNSSADNDGGAVYWNDMSGMYYTGSYGIIANCTFVNSTTNKVYTSSSGFPSSDGGAIYWAGYGGLLANCSFVNSSCFTSSSIRSGSYGGAVYWCGLYGTLSNCSFVNSICSSVSTSSSSTSYGGAVYWSEYAWGGVLRDCIFINSISKSVSHSTSHNYDYGSYGGAVYWYGADGNVVESIFINSRADAGSGIYFKGTNCSLIFATFEDGSYWYSENPLVVVDKLSSVISAPNVNVDYGASKNLVVTLKGSDNNLLAGEQIKIVLNNVEHVLKTDSKGKASLAIPTNLAPNTYKATVSYEGNRKYDSSKATANIVVAKAQSSISAVYNSNEIVATLTSDANGKPVSGASVKFSLNGKTTSVKTNSKGQAKFSTAGLSSGTATISYAGNAKYKSSSTSIEIVPKTDIIISALYDDDANEIVATLTNGVTGKAVSSATVQVDINGATTTVKTDTKGQAKVSTAGLHLGTNTATISYAGNSKYNPASASISFNVKTKVIVTDVYAYSDRIVAKLTNGATGKAIANANMIVEINGVKYNAKSDNKGQLTFDTTGLDLPSAYDLTISYRGNDRYTASSATVAVDLNKANMMITTNYHADKQKMVATLKNSKTGKVVSNANMIIELNGVKTTYKSNNQGKITLLTADFAPGTYVGTVTYPGNARYNSISAVFKVDV